MDCLVVPSRCRDAPPKRVCVCVCVGVVVRKLTEWICLLQISSDVSECDYDTEKDVKHNVLHQNSNHTQINLLTIFLLSVSQRAMNRDNITLIKTRMCHHTICVCSFQN